MYPNIAEMSFITEKCSQNGDVMTKKKVSIIEKIDFQYWLLHNTILIC